MNDCQIEISNNLLTILKGKTYEEELFEMEHLHSGDALGFQPHVVRLRKRRDT